VTLPTKPVAKLKAKKCPEVAPLSDYSVNPPENFWINFPSNPLPSLPQSTVNIDRLIEKIDSVKSLMTDSQKKRAKKIA